MIKQRNNGDCGVSCLAMFCGTTYEHIEKNIFLKLNRKIPINGMSDIEIAQIMVDFKFKPLIVFFIMPNVPSIVCVPSLGTKKKFHYVFWDGKKIYDPSNFETYSTKDFISASPVSSAIICENYLDIDLPSHFYTKIDWNRLKC